VTSTDIPFRIIVTSLGFCCEGMQSTFGMPHCPLPAKSLAVATAGTPSIVISWEAPPATRTRNRERAAWDREHGASDPEVFRVEILPRLVGVPTSQIAAVTGLSRNFVSTVKSGKHVPHQMHWDALRALASRVDSKRP